ncbi:MAG: ribosome silencing factor [Pseudomonadota bacterium]
MGNPTKSPGGTTQGAAIASSDRAQGEIFSLILQQLEDDQANDIVSIDLAGKSDVADALIICSGRSQRHVGAMADKLHRALKEAGFGSASIEGIPACDWVLVDAGDVIVHLFRPEVREFYNLERIWAPELFAADDAVEDGVSVGSDGYAPSTDAIAVQGT